MEETKKQTEENISNTQKSISSQEQSENKSSLSTESNTEKITKKEDKKEKKEKKEEVKKPKKTEAVVNGKSLPISTKYGVAICDYIKGKSVDEAISMLELVLNYKKAVPMKGEIAHRKGRIMSGKYPIKAAQEFIKLLKSLKANAIVNELEIEKYVLFCKADVAPRPYRRFGRTRFKRTHVSLKMVLPVKKKHKTNKNISNTQKNKSLDEQGGGDKK